MACRSSRSSRISTATTNRTVGWRVPAPFVIAAKDFETFGEAILKKLIAEIARVEPSNLNGPRASRAARSESGYFSLIRHLVDAGLGAGLILFAAGRARHSDRPDHVFAGHDRQRACRRDDVVQVNKGKQWVVLEALGHRRGRAAERARRVGFFEAVFHGVRGRCRRRAPAG